MPKRITLAEFQGDKATPEPASPPAIAVRPEVRREHVRLENFRPNPWQPRTTVDPTYVRRLAESIAAEGMHEMILARPAGGDLRELAFGHMRLEAVRLLASEGRWPWPTLEANVRDLSDKEMAIIALVENQDRRDLSPLEQYRAWQKDLLIEGMTQTEMAEALGIARPTLTNALRVLALPPVVLERVDAGELSVHAARELLCLMAEDHAHVDIMEGVIRQIAATQLWQAPDWRGGNVRKRIMEQLGQKRTGEWRHLGAKGLIGMGVHGYGTDFDAEAFAKAFPQRVHILPNDEYEGRVKAKEGSLAWTCDPKEWKRWQARVKTAAQGTMGGVRESKAEEELRTVLARDPVAKRVLASDVSTATAAKAVVERQAAKVEAAGAPAAGMDGKASGYMKLNARLASLTRELSPGTAAWKALHSVDTAERLLGELSLGEHGLDVTAIYDAIGRYVGALDKEIARETAAQKQGITAEQRAVLGTRGEAPLNLNSTKVWHRSLNIGRYNGPPAYFPDIKECLERCIIGARYAKTSSWEGPRLVCTNEAHFAEKLLKGKAVFRLQVEAQRAAMEGRDHPIIDALESRFNALGVIIAMAVAQALLTATDNWRKFRPEDADDFAFDPPSLALVREALGMKTDNLWSVFSSSQVLEGLEKRPEKSPLVAAALIVHCIGGRSDKNALVLAERLGVAQPKTETPIGDARAGAKERIVVKRAARRAKAAVVVESEEQGDEDEEGGDAA